MSSLVLCKMASVDALSDAEIRAKLVDLGCDVGPVTPSTRKVYVKKLQSLIENGNSSNVSSKSQERPPSPSPDETIFKNRQRTPTKPKSKSPSRASAVHPLASSTLVDNIFAQPNILKSSILTDVRPSHITTRDVTPPEKRVSSSTNLPNAGEATFRGNFNYNLNDFNGSSRSKYNSPSAYISGAARFEPDQPYASEFTRRVSSGSSSSRLGSQVGSPRSPLLNSKIYDSVKESDDEEDGTGPVHAKFGPSSRGPPYQRANGQTYLPQGGWFGKDASVIILVFLALFFVVVAYAYFHMHQSESSVSPYVSELSYPRCTEGDLEVGLDGELCIPDQKIKRALLVFKLLCAELSDRATKHGCSKSGAPKISFDEASRLVNMKDGSLSVYELDKHIYYAGVLANHNPSKNVIFSTTDGFKLREVPTSFICTILDHTMLLTFWLIRISLCVGVVLIIYACVKWWLVKRTKHQEEVNKLFSQIIDLVSSTAAQDGPGFAVKAHIMDRLIPAQDKTSKGKMWDEASALADSDSRIRTEVQQVEGEDFLVWRWLAPPPNPKRKVWQGQAFETMDGSVNSLPESPTSCLKIRHMFDPSQEEGEGWVQAVADAILDKCKDATIYHIVVEKHSPEGCVYVKCASPRDAGIAYRALHGFWFDTKLVTVKYIREARYLERFPDSVRAKYPLGPSSKRSQ